jgi:hypothetical protein
LFNHDSWFISDPKFHTSSSFESATAAKKMETQKLVLKIDAGGLTNVFAGLEKALKLFNSNRYKFFIILISSFNDL